MGKVVELNWKDKSVLVTGGSGFIGRNLILALQQRGGRVANLDLIAPRGLERYEKFYLEDVRNYNSVERVMVESKPDFVFHLAALTQVVDAKEIPLQGYATNIMGTANILEAARRTGRIGIPIIVASSDKAYGESARYFPANEDTHLDPIHPYDVSKASADLIARSYARQYHLSVAITRCGNIYGPEDSNWQRLIPGALRAAFLGTTFLVRSNGQLIREYNFVSDIVDANLLIAERLADMSILSGRSFTISDPDTRLSVGAIIQACEEAARYPLKAVKYLDIARDEGQSIQLDSTAIRTLGWSPRVSLKQGLSQTADWMAMELGMSTLLGIR